MASQPFESSEASAVRRAALLLHAMTPDDRAWTLDALHSTDREQLQTLMVELEALGIASDPELISSAVLPTASGFDDGSLALPAAPMSDEDLLRQLSGERLAAWVRLMEAEPIGFLAQCLRVADWPWQADLLRGMAPERRARLEAAMERAQSAPLPPAMRNAMLATGAASLRAVPPIESPARRWADSGMHKSLRRLWPGKRRTGEAVA